MADPPTIRVISYNCWGLKFISTHRHARLAEIGRQLSLASPPPQIVGLQECWTQQDYEHIRASTRHILPYGKFYHSGVFGGGLAILSAWPIEDSAMVRYPLNGRPQAFWRGDWYVGKGVACARIRYGKQEKEVVEVFCTHLHAPYEREPHDSYICHRTAQAWEIAKLMRGAAERGHAVLGLGDFNMLPLSLAHRVVEARGGGVRDVWRMVRSESAVGAWEDGAERERLGEAVGVVPSVHTCLTRHGATCDSVLNTWRWGKQAKKDLLKKGKDRVVGMEEEDPRAKRLDYIFFKSGEAHGWEVKEVEVGMTGRHPELRCSLSDHFSVEATLVRSTSSSTATTEEKPPGLPLETYDAILAMIESYTLRERIQRRLRISHFFFQLSLSIGCLIGVWFSPRPYVNFLLTLLSTVALSVGVMDGLMGLLFVGTEIRALKEFEWEVRNARESAVSQGQDQRGEVADAVNGTAAGEDVKVEAPVHDIEERWMGN